MSFIVLPRKRRRPDRFELDYSHPLAQGLGLCSFFNGNTSVDIKKAKLNLYGDAIISNGLRINANGYASFSNVTQSIINSTYSVSIRAKFPSFSLWNDGDVLFSHDTIKISLVSGYPRWFHGASGNYLNNIRFAGGSLVDMAFIHTSTTKKAYQNSLLKDSIGYDLAQIGQQSGPFSLFINAPGPITCDHVLYHNRALSEDEIALLADRTDPMLAGLIKEKRTAPIYFLPSVNHWELQIKVDEGEWTAVGNLASDIEEYVKSAGLVSGTYYARIRKFTNGVPSDWEYSAGVVYSTGTGGTPYSLVQSLLASLGVEFGVSQSVRGAISSPFEAVQDGRGATSSAYAALQDASAATSLMYVLQQDGRASLASNYLILAAGQAGISTTLAERVHDALATLSEHVGYVVTQDVLASIATEAVRTFVAQGKISEPHGATFDFQGKVSEPVGVSHDAGGTLRTATREFFDTRASLTSELRLAQDLRGDISTAVTFVSDAMTAIGLGVSYSVTLDGLAKIETALVARQSAVVSVSTNISEIFDAAAKLSSGLIVVQDGRAVVIDVDIATIAKIELPTTAMLHYSGMTVARLQGVLESTVVTRKSLPAHTKVIFIKIGG